MCFVVSRLKPRAADPCNRFPRTPDLRNKHFGLCLRPAIFELSWALLGFPGLFWVLLGAIGSTGLSWALMGSPGPSWVFLGSPGLS